MRARGNSPRVFWLQAILIKMIGNDHRGRAQLAWIPPPSDIPPAEGK